MYNFIKSNNVFHQPVDIIGGKFQIKSPNKDWNTILLELNVKKIALRKRCLPNVAIGLRGNESSVYVQYLPSKPNGSQYLNLSHLLAEYFPLGQVQLVGDGIRIKDQKAILHCFNTIQTKDKKIMVVAPHPDDAEIAAFGLYSRCQYATLIHITAGDSLNDRYSFLDGELSERQLLGRLRCSDTLVASQWGKYLPNVINLGYPDSLLKEMYEFQDSCPKNRYEISDINTYRTYYRHPPKKKIFLQCLGKY